MSTSSTKKRASRKRARNEAAKKKASERCKEINCTEVSKWLEEKGMGQFKKHFAVHDFKQMDEIYEITPAYLEKKMFIEKEGCRIRIINAIKAHKTAHHQKLSDEEKKERDAKGETDVGFWLRKTVGIADALLDDYQTAFKKKGYKEMATLKHVDLTILDDMKLTNMAHYQKAILSDIQKLFPHAPAEIIAAPDVKLDDVQSTLQGKLKADDTDHNVRIKSNTQQGGTGAEAKYFSSLNDLERESLLENLKLYCGRGCSADGVEIKTWPIFKLKDDYQELDLHFVMDTKSSFVCDTTFDSSQTSMSINGYSNTSAGVSASGGYGPVSAEVSASASSSSADSRTGGAQTEMATDIAIGLYPRGFIVLDERCLTLTQTFKNDLEEFLEMGEMDADDDEYQEIKEQFYEKYGTWVDLKVHIGGKIYATQKRARDVEKSAAEHQEDFKKKVSAAVSSPYGGAGVEASKGSGGGNEEMKQNIQESGEIRVDSIGGENTSVSQTDWSKWQDSVASNSQTWAVIDVKKCCSVLALKRFMDEKFYEKIERAYTKIQFSKPADVPAVPLSLWDNEVVHNYDARKFEEAGWISILDDDSNYDSDSTKEKLEGKPSNTKIFVGVAEAGNLNNILVGAFGPLSVLQYNTLPSNKAAIPQSLLDGQYKVHWYNKAGRAFGFASLKDIDIEKGITDMQSRGEDNNRLSWASSKVRKGLVAGVAAGAGARAPAPQFVPAGVPQFVADLEAAFWAMQRAPVGAAIVAEAAGAPVGAAIAARAGVNAAVVQKAVEAGSYDKMLDTVYGGGYDRAGVCSNPAVMRKVIYMAPDVL